MAHDMAHDPVVVAVVNTNPDLVRILRGALERVGFIVTIIHIEDIKLAAVDVEAFLRDNNPRVIVYDVAPPYDQNWMFLQHLRTATGFKGRHFVLTTVNSARLHEIVGPEESVYEIVGGEADIGVVVRAVKEASRARPTR